MPFSWSSQLSLSVALSVCLFVNHDRYMTCNPAWGTGHSFRTSPRTFLSTVPGHFPRKIRPRYTPLRASWAWQLMSCLFGFHSSCHKTGVNDLSCCIRMWAQLSFVLSQSRVWQMDGRTNRRTDSFFVARPRCMQCMQRDCAVKRLLQQPLFNTSLQLCKTYQAVPFHGS